MNDHIIGEVKENGGSPKDAANCRPNSALKLQPIIWRVVREQDRMASSHWLIFQDTAGFTSGPPRERRVA
eukprot:1180230-Prorocentrum_minimum.AAC.3